MLQCFCINESDGDRGARLAGMSVRKRFCGARIICMFIAAFYSAASQVKVKAFGVLRWLIDERKIRENILSSLEKRNLRRFPFLRFLDSNGKNGLKPHAQMPT
jgi:hypothetical protein